MTTTTPAAGIAGLDELPAKDQIAIGTTLTRLLGGFSRRNADLLKGVYSDDADWVNAFGSEKKGGPEIIDYLRGLFADQNFDNGQLVAAPHSVLRRITDDVVTVSTHLQISGQGLVGGGAIPLRDNHSLRILHKQPDGSWLIVSEMYSASRTDQTYVNHS